MTIEATQGKAVDSWKPPYVSYATLINFIDEKLAGGKILPPRIDRGLLETYSGSVQAQLMATLRTMGMIADDGQVKEALKIAARNPESRREEMRKWASSYYRAQLDLAGRNGTGQMLAESFSAHHYSGSTLRKAIVFYLTLVDDTGLPNSPYFKAPKQVRPAGTAPRRRRTSTAVSPPASPILRPAVASTETGERKHVSFGAAGSVTINVDVRWLDLPDDTFTKLRQIVRDLEALSPASSVADMDEDEDEDPEGL